MRYGSEGEPTTHHPEAIDDASSLHLDYETQNLSEVVFSSAEELTEQRDKTMAALHPATPYPATDRPRLILQTDHASEIPPFEPSMISQDPGSQPDGQLVMTFDIYTPGRKYFVEDTAPYIPGYQAKATNRMLYILTPHSEGDPYAQPAVPIPPDRLPELAAAYHRIGLNDLADVLRDPGELAISELIELIRLSSVYLFDNKLEGRTINMNPQPDSLADFQELVSDNHLHVQSTAAEQLLSLSIQTLFPEDKTWPLKGLVVYPKSRRIHGIVHSQTAWLHDGNMRLLDAMPPIPSIDILDGGDYPPGMPQPMAEESLGIIRNVIERDLARVLGREALLINNDTEALQVMVDNLPLNDPVPFILNAIEITRTGVVQPTLIQKMETLSATLIKAASHSKEPIRRGGVLRRYPSNFLIQLAVHTSHVAEIAARKRAQ